MQSYTFNNYFDLVVWHLQPRQEQRCCNFALPSGSQVIIFCSGLPSSILLQETIVPSDPFLKTICRCGGSICLQVQKFNTIGEFWLDASNLVCYDSLGLCPWSHKWVDLRAVPSENRFSFLPCTHSEWVWYLSSSCWLILFQTCKLSTNQKFLVQQRNRWKNWVPCIG